MNYWSLAWKLGEIWSYFGSHVAHAHVTCEHTERTEWLLPVRREFDLTALDTSFSNEGPIN